MSSIVVTGMHRSGTSLLAEVLVRGGANFGSAEHWLPADVSNPHGYFEDRRVVSLDDRLLQLWKGTWDEPPPLPARWLDDPRVAPLAREAQAWIASAATTGCWGWKDPRSSLVLPFWRRACPDLRCVLCIRDPLEVGRSLEKRDRIPPDKAAFLWLRYLADGLDGIGDARCAMYFFGEFLSEPTPHVRHLFAFCGMDAEGAIDACVALVDPELRRQRAERPPEPREAPLELCRSVYARVRAIVGESRTPDEDARREAVGAVRAALGVLGLSPEVRRKRLQVRFTELELAQTTARDLRLAHDRAAALAAEKEREIARAREAIVERDRALGALERTRAEEAEAARAALARRDEALGRAERLVAETDATLARARARVSELEELEKHAAARADALQREVASAGGALESAERTLQDMVAERATWQQRRHALVARMGARLAAEGGLGTRFHGTRPLARADRELAAALLLENAVAAHFDRPDFGGVEEGEVQFTGWCIHASREITALTLCLNGTAHPTRFGLDRPDVGAAFPQAPGSGHSGFLVAVPLRAGRYLVSLEVQCKDVGADLYVASQVLVVRRRPFRGRAVSAATDAAGMLGYAALKLRRRLAAGRGLPSWREIPAQLRRAQHEFERRHRGDGGLQPPEGFALPAPVDPYDAWLVDNRWGPRAEAELRDRLAATRNLPRLSIVTPVYRPDLAHFRATAESVRAQVYADWEWCIADDASGDPELTAALAEFGAQDPRIRCVTRTENGHISAATNSAAALARGEFVALLDHDDLLAPDCLAEIALHLAAHDDVDVLYTDDDKVDVDGRRFGPQFKPDFSPESLLSQMYFSHLFVVRRSLYAEVGGMREGFEGSQDHDLALRVVEKARRVAHLPFVLYHWRAAPGSTALSGEAKSYSFEAGMRAVAEALARRGVPAVAVRPEWAVQAKASLIRHVFPDDGPRVAILIATRNHLELLKRCVDSLGRTLYRNFEVVILDDDSDDPDTLAWLAAFPGRVLRSPVPRAGFNFAALHNHAAREIDAEFLLLLNNDTEVRAPGWLSQMVGFARLPGVGAVGARLLFPDRTVQHAGILHGFNQGSLALAFRGLWEDDPGYLAAARVCRNYGAVTAACLLTPRRLFLELGGFDERNFPVSFNDVDYCYRLVDRGYRCVYAAEAELYHHEGASRGIGSRIDEIARFRERYHGRREPYYSPNLSTTSERFEIRPRHLARRPDRPVRALMVAHTLDLTGAPFCQWEMTVALHARGRLDPVVVSPEDGPLRALYEEHGIGVRIVPHGVDNVGSMADYERELAAFTQRVLDADVEVVYGNTLKTFFAIDAARRVGLPSLWNVRESEPWQTYYSYLPDTVACRALECFALPYRVLFVSNASRAVFEPLNSRHNFQVIHDGLDLAQWAQRSGGANRDASRHALGIGTGEVVIVLLGTVCERKGQHDLAHALALLDPEVASRLRCFIVGDRPGEYSRALAGIVHRLPAALRRRVHVVPETRDVAAYYRAADVFVCTSRIESYPRVTLEAMACALPIVSTPVFGLAEQLVDEANALLYPPGDVALLATALERLARDGALRQRMGAASPVVLAGLKSFGEMVDDYAVQFAEAREVR